MQTRFTERGRTNLYSASYWYRIGRLDCKADRDFQKNRPKDYETGYRDQYAEDQMMNEVTDNEQRN